MDNNIQIEYLNYHVRAPPCMVFLFVRLKNIIVAYVILNYILGNVLHCLTL